MIILDTRTQQHQPQFLPIFVGAFGRENVKIEKMQFGDIAFNSQYEYAGKIRSVGIEHSTLNDFASKINNGRLAFQMSGMREAYDVSILLLEGSIIRDKVTGAVKMYGGGNDINWERFQEIRFSLEMHGVKVFSERTRNEAAKRVVSWYRWWQKKPEDHKLLQRRESELTRTITPAESSELSSDIPDFSLSPGSAMDRAVVALSDLVQGLGPEKVEEALKVYHQIDLLAVTPEEKLRHIKGWGPVLAKRFRQAVTKRHYV